MHKELAKEWTHLVDELDKKAKTGNHEAAREYEVAETHQRVENRRLAQRVAEL